MARVTRRAFEEALAGFEKTRTAHGEPDNSARLERMRKEDEERRRNWSRGRGGGLSHVRSLWVYSGMSSRPVRSR